MEQNVENVIQIQTENESESVIESQTENRIENGEEIEKKLKPKSEQRVWLEIFLKPAVVSLIILGIARIIIFEPILIIMLIEAFIGIIWTWVEVIKYIKPTKKRLLIYFLNPMLYYYIFFEIRGIIMIFVNGIQLFGRWLD